MIVILASCWILWTAPGDDGNRGRATRYEARISATPVEVSTDTTAWWAQATPVPGMPAPGIAGATDSVRVTNLERGTMYFVLIRTADEKPNWSGWSNVIVKLPAPPPELILVHP